MMRIGVLGLLAPALCWSAVDISSFRERKTELEEFKARCQAKSEPDRTECLSDFNNKKEKYKRDYAKFKERIALENLKREERRTSKSPKSIEGDIDARKGSIEEFKSFYNSSCENSISVRCGSALYQLGNLTFKNEEDDFRITQSKYEKEMQKWEDRDMKGAEPIAPKRNHAQSLAYFKMLRSKYPKYPDMDKVLYRMAYIYSVQGDDDGSYALLKEMTANYPNSSLRIPAYLRMGEHWLLLRKYRQAIEQYEKIPTNYPGPEAGLALYHKAECYYNMADFEKAAKLYYEYVTKSEKGLLKGDLKAEALEFMAACWADLDNGVKIAHDFLRGKGHGWEKDIYYEIGKKNKAHDRLEEARIAFEHLLEIAPDYPKAPIADMAIVEILLIQKRPDEAQQARMELVQRYQPGSSWETSNVGNKEDVEEAKKAVKAAMFQIPVYYHFKGTRDKENLDEESLLKAEAGYKEYLSRYPDGSWDVYEAHQNLGSVYHMLKRYTDAATEYAWCASANTEKFGKLSSEKKKSILTRADAAYNRVYMMDLARQAAVKARGGDKAAAYSDPETRMYFAAVDEFMKEFGKSSNTPDIAYNAALVHYEAKQYAKAITSLTKLAENFPNHKHSKLILRMLGQSLLENGQYLESEQTFAKLLKGTQRDSKEYKEVELSVASALFKQADKEAQSGNNAGAASTYLKVVNSYKSVEIADKALFEAGIQFEEAGDVQNSTNALLRIHKEYPESGLKIKSILRAASIFKKNSKFREAAQTFLIVRDRFPKDTTAFDAIGWAAEAYEEIPDPIMAARTYESALDHFPKHEKTPALLYNAAQSYEEAKNFESAVNVYNTLGSKYPKSNYALEAVFSVPIIQEKQGQYSNAAASYERFISKYRSDPQKLVRAQLGAGKIYDLHLDQNDKALEYYAGVRKTFESAGEGADIPAAIPAEAAYRSGEIYFDKVATIRLDESEKANEKLLKEMAKNLEQAVEHYSFAVEQSEQEWTLRSTMRMGDLFMAMANATKNEKISTNDPIERTGKKILILRDLPPLYEKAKGLYQKNLDLAREQGVQSPWVDTSRVKYMETFWEKGQIFEEIGVLLSQSPIPKGLSPEEEQDYKAALEDKAYEALQAAKPIYATGLKAAQFYRLENEIKQQLESRLRYIDPEASELSLESLPEEEVGQGFVDSLYKLNMDKIASIYEDESMSDPKKVQELKALEEEAKKAVERLLVELNESASAGAPTAKTNE